MPQGKRKVKGPALLIKRYVDPNSKHVYYGQVTVGGETYSCGECVAMETAEGTFVAEVLYIFKDQHGQAWVENRWLFNKQEVQEALPKRIWPEMEDAELLETNEVTSNPASAIVHKVAVLDETDFRDRVRRGMLNENRDFFCTKYLDTNYHRFMPAGAQGPDQRLRRGRRFSDRYDGPDDGNASSSDDDSSSSSSGSEDGKDEDEDGDGDGDDGGEDKKGRDGDVVHISEVASAGAGAGGGSDNMLGRPAEERPHKRRRVSSSGGGGRSEKKKQDKYSLALDRLHARAVPKSLPCRDKEKKTMLEFLRSNVKCGGLGDALFIAGMPGTGKTATAMEVVRLLREQQARGGLPEFKLVTLNGMRLVRPHQAYTQLWMALEGEMLSPKRALSKLEHYFSDSDPDRQFVVLLVDELDYMTTPKQTVLYNLFEWPSRVNARLVMVGIANTMDLPERCLPRISSRITSRLMFPAYNKNQLVVILQQRLAEANASAGKQQQQQLQQQQQQQQQNAFNPGAISLTSAKVAAASGDMRTCLKYCCRAIEICKDRVLAAKAEGKEKEELSEVTAEDVRRAVKEINQQAHLLAIRDAAPQEKLLIVAICVEVHQSGRDSVEMDLVRERMIGMCRAHPNGPRMPNVSTILEMLSRLGDGHVISFDLSRRAPLPDVELNMSTRDVVMMLRDDTQFSRKVLPEALLSEC